MKTTVYTAEEQSIFRTILESEGLVKMDAIQALIENKLDAQAAIIEWLKRTNNYDHYKRLKNERVESVIIINPED